MLFVGVCLCSTIIFYVNAEAFAASLLLSLFLSIEADVLSLYRVKNFLKQYENRIHHGAVAVCI